MKFIINNIFDNCNCLETAGQHTSIVLKIEIHIFEIATKSIKDIGALYYGYLIVHLINY